uniref:Uncharacterized protein n=1 Tax=Cacopsylla melanoneura TaxID=428564 RepID=A0A8D9E5S0_9HEMI
MKMPLETNLIRLRGGRVLQALQRPLHRPLQRPRQLLARQRRCQPSSASRRSFKTCQRLRGKECKRNGPFLQLYYRNSSFVNLEGENTEQRTKKYVIHYPFLVNIVLLVSGTPVP